jgi:hypothetical protein
MAAVNTMGQRRRRAQSLRGLGAAPDRPSAGDRTPDRRGIRAGILIVM